MKAVISFNPHAATHKWTTIIYDDDGKVLFGMAIDAASEEEAKQKAKRYVEE